MNAEDWRLARPLILAGLVLGLALLGVYIIIELRHLLLVLFLGLVIGVALNPIVDRFLLLRIPPVLGVLLVYAVVAALLAVFGYAVVREVGQQAADFQLERLKADYDSLAEGTLLPPSDDLEVAAKDLAANVSGGVLNQATSLIGAFFSFFTILFTGLLFTITQDRMRGILLSFVKEEQREHIVDLLHKLADGLRRFVLAEIAAMTAVGIITFIGLTIIGLEFAVLLAFVAFLTEVLPIVGPWIAFVPAFAVALTDGFWTAVQVAALYLFIQSLESYVVTPLVHGRGTQMPAMLIFVSLLVGAALMGILGAIVSLPLAVCIYVLFFEVVLPWNHRRVGNLPKELRETPPEVEDTPAEVKDSPAET